MSTYRIEWPCCRQVTETEAYEPDQCPFCERDRLAAENAELVNALDIVMRYPKINEYMGGQISRIAEEALAKVKESKS